MSNPLQPLYSLGVRLYVSRQLPLSDQVAILILGRYTCGNWQPASSHEWLVTNGLGGFACGTVAGANTRRYHGFLMASLRPPVERTLLVAKVDLAVEYLGGHTELAANEFGDGTIDPKGLIHLESFAVQDGIPTWRYAVADALLEQRIFMAPGANTSYLSLELLRASAPLHAVFKPFVTYRDYHSHGRGARPFRLQAAGDSCTVQAFDGARPYRLILAGGEFAAAGTWYWNFRHRVEAERGLDALEDLWMPGTFGTPLVPHQPAFLVATAEEQAPMAGPEVFEALRLRSRRLTGALPKPAPGWIQALALASDQFIVQRGDRSAGASSVIAGYPWFADWGRDTMIALPGLATALGRYDVAAGILRTYAGFVDRGMLPNRFPDGGEAPEYNTADATLWLFNALRDYLEAKRDPALVNELFPTLLAIIHAHAEGTRFGIQVDPLDGLLRAGEPGSQLTWMDAKHGDQAFTPRIGKPVEINALWLNALDLTARLAGYLRNDAEQRFCQGLLERGGAGFGRFWNQERGCLFDVIDVNGGTERDAAMRPNQILAVALPYCTLTDEQMRAVVECCARELLTSHGLRSLALEDPAYLGGYSGGPAERDAAYHQGTVWSWLLGPFARAHFRVYGDARLAQTFLAPIAQHVNSACVGSVSEIFDGDAPHTARGCFAQAWSVAEILRSWIYLERKISTS
jgi:predicted glycogen debranching enzyme